MAQRVRPGLWRVVPTNGGVRPPICECEHIVQTDRKDLGVLARNRKLRHRSEDVERAGVAPQVLE